VPSCANNLEHLHRQIAVIVTDFITGYTRFKSIMGGISGTLALHKPYCKLSSDNIQHGAESTMYYAAPKPLA
jgi:hypothetical protein